MKPSNRIPLIIAGVVVVAVVAGTFVLRDRDVVEPAGVPEAVAEAAPAAAPARAPAPARPVVDRQEIGERLVDEVERRAQMRKAQEERTRALREASIQRYTSEQVDPAWAPGKINELTGLADDPGFETANAQPQSLNVDCRSSMCRIEGQFETAGKAEDWILMYMSGVGSAMPNSVVSRRRNPDGTTRVEIYGRGR